MRRLILCAFCATALSAQTMELSGSAGLLHHSGNPLGFLGYAGTTPANEVRLGNGWQAGGRMTFHFSRRFGHELGAMYGRHDLNAAWNGLFTIPVKRGVWQVFYDFLLYATPPEAPVRPYLAVGAGMSRFDAVQALPVMGKQGDTKFGPNYGAGAKLRVTRFSFVRIDFREYLTPKPLQLIQKTGWLRQHELSAGFGIVL